MSAIKTIRTRNIQSHRDVYVELPETGLVVFTGDNSNGKSVIRRVLHDTISYAIRNVRVRKTLINKECNEGYLEITKYDGSVLLININIEAALTWVKLTRPNGEEVTRYLSDKTIPELIREFGFHYDDNRGVSLNICDSDESILFFRTSHATNYDIITSALTDSDAQMRYEVLKEQYQQASNLKAQFQDAARVATAARTSLAMYNVEEEKELMDRLYKCANIMEHTYVPKLRKVNPVPYVKFITLPEVKLRKVYSPKFIELPQVRLKDTTRLQAEIDSLLKGECPTCHRPYCS